MRLEKRNNQWIKLGRYFNMKGFNLTRELRKIPEEIKFSFNDVADVAYKFAEKGYSPEEILEKTKSVFRRMAFIDNKERIFNEVLNQKDISIDKFFERFGPNKKEKETLIKMSKQY
jgi:hypothetical protein